MSKPATGMTTLTFDRFWKWLKDHQGCILRAATPDGYLYDHDSLHWNLAEETDSLVVQLVLGKAPIGEIFLDPRDLRVVQVSPDSEEEGSFLFEVFGANAEEPAPAHHFLMAHGYEEEALHPQGYKH